MFPVNGILHDILGIISHVLFSRIKGAPENFQETSYWLWELCRRFIANVPGYVHLSIFDSASPNLSSLRDIMKRTPWSYFLLVRTSPRVSLGQGTTLRHQHLNEAVVFWFLSKANLNPPFVLGITSPLSSWVSLLQLSSLSFAAPIFLQMDYSESMQTCSRIIWLWQKSNKKIFLNFTSFFSYCTI